MAIRNLQHPPERGIRTSTRLERRPNPELTGCSQSCTATPTSRQNQREQNNPKILSSRDVGDAVDGVSAPGLWAGGNLVPDLPRDRKRSGGRSEATQKHKVKPVRALQNTKTNTCLGTSESDTNRYILWEGLSYGKGTDNVILQQLRRNKGRRQRDDTADNLTNGGRSAIQCYMIIGKQ